MGHNCFIDSVLKMRFFIILLLCNNVSAFDFNSSSLTPDNETIIDCNINSNCGLSGMSRTNVNFNNDDESTTNTDSITFSESTTILELNHDSSTQETIFEETIQSNDTLTQSNLTTDLNEVIGNHTIDSESSSKPSLIVDSETSPYRPDFSITNQAIENDISNSSKFITIEKNTSTVSSEVDNNENASEYPEATTLIDSVIHMTEPLLPKMVNLSSKDLSLNDHLEFEKPDDIFSTSKPDNDVKLSKDNIDMPVVENKTIPNDDAVIEDEIMDQSSAHHMFDEDEQKKDEDLKVVNIKKMNTDDIKNLVKNTENKNKELMDKDSSKRKQSTLAFVFDATGSMYNDLVELRNGAKLILQTMLKREDKPIKNYVLVPYRDPEVGPITVTSDHNELIEDLENISIYGGGNCPESSLSGITAALNVSLPYSYVYVFTDATAIDHHLVENVLSLIQRKQSQIVFVLTGDCQNRDTPHYKVYEQIATASSGQIFHLEKSDLNVILSYIKDSLDSNRVNLDSIINPPGNHQHKLAVDETLKKVTVSVAGHEPKISFTNPAGEIIDKPPKVEQLVDLSDVQVINLINPEPGNWTINIGSLKDHSVRVTGLSNIMFSHGFSEHDPKDMDDTSLRPLKGAQSYLMISTENNAELDKLTTAEIVNMSGYTLFEVPLEKMKIDEMNTVLYKSEPVLLPDHLFNIAINGLDKSGNMFRRTSTTGVQSQEPEKPRITVVPEVTGEYHSQITLRCRAESLVPITMWWFKDGQPVTSKEHMQSSILKYTIVDLTEDSEGSYICKASNIAGVSADKTDVAFTGQPPSVQIYPRNLNSANNSDVRVQCFIESKLPVSLKIYHRNLSQNESASSLTLLQEIDEMDFGATTEFIHSFVLTEQTQGKYSCVVSNRAGMDKKETEIKIRSPLKVNVHPKIIEFLTGVPFGFSCVIEGTTDGYLTVENNDILESNIINNEEITRVPFDENKGIQIFYDVKHPNKSYEGVYYCHGVRDGESVYDSAEVRYMEAPTIDMKNTTLLFKLDSLAVINCEMSGIPEPTISWFGSDGNQIQTENGIMKRIHVNENNQLVIYNINPVDNGKYSCKAENQFGTAKKDVEVIVFQKPYFIEMPEDQALNIYTSAVLTCKADGIPKPKLTWYHNDIPYNEVELLAESGVNLHLRNVEMHHNGKYSCVAENEYDKIQEDIFISVIGLEPPAIFKGNKTIVLAEGDPFKFVCRLIRGKPYPKLSWEKDGESIWENDSESGKGEGSDLEFIFESIIREQEGNYSCIGRNIAGEDRYDFTLEVHSPPVFFGAENIENDYDYEDTGLIVKPMEVIAGEEMSLKCKVQGKPPPLITWSKDGLPVVYTNIVYMDDNSSLIVSQVKETDGGVYTCFASNPAGISNKNFTVDVLVRPTITLNESSLDPVIQTVEGQLVMLPCPVYAVPFPQVVWTYNYQSIAFSNRIQIDSDNKLRFVANLTDAGVYRCEATNKAGNTSKEYVLLVYVPPYVYPSGTEIVKTKDGDKIELDCDATGFPIPTIRWSRNGQTLSNSSGEFEFDESGKLNITNITKNTSGIYTCEAENLAGLAEKLFHVVLNEAPNILPSEVPVNIDLIAGEEEFNIPCKASGNPTPYTTWLKNGKYIVNDLHTKVLTDGTLSLKFITESLNGKYTCQAANTEGSIEIDYTVKVVAPPSLLETEDNTKTIVTTEGSTVVLECPLRPSHVLPKIQWYKDSELIELNETSSKLIFVNVSRSDASQYSCLASNTGGRVSALLKLVVHWPPVFVNNITNDDELIHLLEGDPMILACHVDANPMADVQWLKNLEIVGDVSPIFKRNHIKTHHAGEHMCVATNPHGQIKKKFVIHVSSPPQIQGFLHNDIEVRVGQPVKLDCYATGYPKPNIEWSTQYAADWDIIGDGKILKAFNITSKSEGKYSCKAANKAGEAEKVFNITVLEPPSTPTVLINDTEPKSSIISLQHGTNLTVTCLSSGQPPGTVMWVRNGMILNKDSLTVNRSDLHLVDLQMHDSGKYTCVTKNKVGAEEFDIDIDVLVPPKILKENFNNVYVVLNEKSIEERWQKIESLEKQTIQLNCPTYGNPPPDIYWFKNNKYLVFYDSQMMTQHYGQILTIQSASRDSRGNYTCVARNKVGEEKFHFNVDVWEPPFVDQQKDGSQAYVATKGENMHLECPVVSNPPPRIRWLKSPYSEIIGGDKNAHHQMKEGNSTLMIQNLTTLDSGNYTCIATNIVGMVEITFSIEVVEAPVIVEDLEDAKKQNMYPNGTIVTKVRRSFQLVCNAVAHPEPDIVWYKDGFQLHKTFTGDTFHISNDGRYLNIMDIRLNNAGKYVCNAYNKIGSAEKEFIVKVLVPAEWSMWSQWSECSETCGPGIRKRHRECQFHGDLEAVGGVPLRILHDSTEESDSNNNRIADELLDKSACQGDSEEQKECFIVPCKVDGDWSSWGDWTSCSVLCGLGSRRRYRSCSSPRPQFGGKPCSGADAQQEPCIGQNCSQWFAWSAWSECSVSCGAGIQSRIRNCNGPADSCLGSPKEFIPCKMTDCPGKWGDWSDWGPCSVTCGSGIRRRHRECLGMNCTGGNIQIERCRDIPKSCNKYDKNSKNLFYANEKVIYKDKDIEMFGKNSASHYYSELSKKKDYLPSMSFINAPEVMNENKIAKKLTTITSNNLKTLYSGFESDTDDVQLATGRETVYRKKIIKPNDDGVNVDVIIDKDAENDNSDVSYFHSLETAPLNIMKPPSILTVHTCTEGYFYDESTHSCKDINECQDTSNACHSTQLCENLPGSYRCLCQRGYMSMGRGQRCLDINECLQNVHECSHDCVNMAGTYRCACPTGMKLTTDNRTCVQEENASYFMSAEKLRPYSTTIFKPIPIHLPINHKEKSSSEDETILLTRISPKRGKPVRRRRPHKHTFESDYDDYDVKVSPRESLSPIDDDEYADINDGEGKQRISKQTTWDSATESPNDEDKDVYMSHEIAKSEIPTSTDKIESIFNIKSESKNFTNIKSTPSLRMKSGKVNRKVTVFGKTSDDKDMDTSEEDSYEDDESNLFEDNCPDGYHLDHEKCVDIDECAINMNSCNGVTNACINTIGSHMCLPTPCPESYKRNNDGICEQHCDERDTVCSEAADLTQIMVYIIVSTSTQETKVPGAILSLQYGGTSNHTTYTLDRQPKGETFYVSTDDKTGTVFTLMPPTFKRVNRVIISGRTFDETEEKLLHYAKFVIYLYISN